VGSSGDASGSMDVETDVVVAAGDALTAVNAHPHVQWLATGPRRRCDGSLRCDSSGDCGRSVAEDNEERVALGGALDSASLREC
jgi:hypothetical protein